MAKITKVEAYGLWSHYQSTFNFAPGLTIITGNNDTGKSALIRIIKWVFLGEPSGEKFIFTIRDEKTKEEVIDIINQEDRFLKKVTDLKIKN